MCARWPQKTWKKTKKIFLYSVGAAIAAAVAAAEALVVVMLVAVWRVEGKKNLPQKPS